MLLKPVRFARQSETFDGATSVINLGSPDYFDNLHLKGGVTIITVFRETGNHEGNFGYVLSKCNSTATAGWRFILGSGTANERRFGFGSDSTTSTQPFRSTVVGGTPSYNRNEWSVAAATWTGGLANTSIELYLGPLGAALKKATAFSYDQSGSGSITSDASSEVLIGNRTDLTRTVNGQIACVFVIRGVLSQGQIQAIVDGGLDPTQSNVLLAWAGGRDYSLYRRVPSVRTAVTPGPIPPRGFIKYPRRFLGQLASGPITRTVVGDGAGTGTSTQSSTKTSAVEGTSVGSYAVVVAAPTASTSRTVVGESVGSFGQTQRDKTATVSISGAENSNSAVASGRLIQISDAYERSSVNLTNSSVSGSGDSAVITIRPRRQSSEVGGADRWLEPSAQVTGVNGTRPTFRFDSYKATGTGIYHGHPWGASRRPMYSYDGGLTWAYFDTAVTINDGAEYVEFRLSTAFTGDSVRIGRSRQTSIEQIGAWLEGLATSYPTIVGPTPTAVSFTPTLTTWSGQAFIADEYASQLNELGQTIPATPLYAAQINDTSLMPFNGQPKQLAVLFGGTHAGEDHGNWVLKTMVEKLLGSSTWAQSLRRNFKILIYPGINAPGRAGGGWRGSYTVYGGHDDANRHFTGTTTLPIVTKPKAAVTTDLDSAVPAFFIDFHGTYYGTWGIFKTTGKPLQETFRTRQATNSGHSITDFGSTPTGSTEDYFFSSLNTLLALTYEAGDPSQVADATIDTNADALVKTLDSMYLDGLLGLPVVGSAGAGGTVVSSSLSTTTRSISGHAGSNSSLDRFKTSTAAVAGNASAAGDVIRHRTANSIVVGDAATRGTITSESSLSINRSAAGQSSAGAVLGITRVVTAAIVGATASSAAVLRYRQGESIVVGRTAAVGEITSQKIIGSLVTEAVSGNSVARGSSVAETTRTSAVAGLSASYTAAATNKTATCAVAGDGACRGGGTSTQFAGSLTLTPDDIAAIAAAVLAAAQAAPIAADVKKVNAITVAGTGVPVTDPWGPA